MMSQIKVVGAASTTRIDTLIITPPPITIQKYYSSLETKKLGNESVILTIVSLN